MTTINQCPGPDCFFTDDFSSNLYSNLSPNLPFLPRIIQIHQKQHILLVDHYHVL